MKCITGLEVNLLKRASCDAFAMFALSNMFRNIETAKSGHVDLANSIISSIEPNNSASLVTSLDSRGHQFSGALLPRDSSDLNGDGVWSDTSKCERGQ